MVRRADAIVVGAGINGAATAWWLARTGRNVVVLERHTPAHAGGSSHGGVRIFRFAYPEPEYVALAQRALELWREAEAESGETLVELTGGIDCGYEPDVKAVADALDATGTGYEWLAAEAAQERWPQFRFTGPVVFQPQGGRCFAERSVRALLAIAERNGAEVRCGEAVTALAVHGDDAVVRTAIDEYRAPVCVIAAGAWTAALASGVLPLPELLVTREQPVFFRSIAGDDPWPSFIDHADPGPFGGIACYGLAEPGRGIKVGRHHTGDPVDPDSPTELDAEATALVVAAAERWIPGVDPTPLGSDSCLYTTTANEDFVIDRRGPFTVASACSGHGFKFGPATGELVAKVALGERPPPERFRFR